MFDFVFFLGERRRRSRTVQGRPPARAWRLPASPAHPRTPSTHIGRRPGTTSVERRKM